MQTQNTPFFLLPHKLKMNERTRRSKFEISYEILRLCIEPAAKNRIMLFCNLSPKLTKAYLKHLMARGFLEQDRGSYYQTTDWGKEFLEGLDIILQIWHHMACANFPFSIS